MQDIKLICVGKLKESFYISAFGEYEKRLKGLCSFSCTELPEIKLTDSPSDKEIMNALDKEGDKVLAAIPSGAFVVSLCVEGKQLSSNELSDMLRERAMSGKPNVVFVIGSSYGLSDKVKAASDFRLSISKMTFPHHLARVILAEQIYRAYKIADGSRYHK